MQGPGQGLHPTREFRQPERTQIAVHHRLHPLVDPLAELGAQLAQKRVGRDQHQRTETPGLERLLQITRQFAGKALALLVAQIGVGLEGGPATGAVAARALGVATQVRIDLAGLLPPLGVKEIADLLQLLVGAIPGEQAGARRVGQQNPGRLVHGRPRAEPVAPGPSGRTPRLRTMISPRRARPIERAHAAR